MFMNVIKYLIYRGVCMYDYVWTHMLIKNVLLGM